MVTVSYCTPPHRIVRTHTYCESYDAAAAVDMPPRLRIYSHDTSAHADRSPGRPYARRFPPTFEKSPIGLPPFFRGFRPLLGRICARRRESVGVRVHIQDCGGTCSWCSAPQPTTRAYARVFWVPTTADITQSHRATHPSFLGVAGPAFPYSSHSPTVLSSRGSS